MQPIAGVQFGEVLFSQRFSSRSLDALLSAHRLPLVQGQMTELRRNRFADGVMAASSGAVLVGGAVALSDDVRVRIASAFSGDVVGELAVAGARLQHVARTTTAMVGYQGAENGPLAVFALTALVLVVL